MKIVILQDRLRLGGTESQAIALGGQWLDAQADVQLVVFRPGGELAASLAAQRLRSKVLQPFDSRLDNWAPGLLKTVTALKPDVVVAFGREANAKLPMLKKLLPQPLLVATLRSGREQPLLFWKALRAADRVIANARWTGAAAITQGVAPERLQVIYNGLARDVQVADPAAARAMWRQRARTPEDAVAILCVAGFRPGKGQDLLLRAAARLPADLSWQLWLAGGGSEESSMRRLVARLKLEQRVFFAGVVDDMASLYAAADVAALASEAEALPNFLIEAQAAGLPVVATTVGGVSECFVDGQTGLGAAPDDSAALTAALERAIRDENWRKDARDPAKDRAAELFDPRRNARRWLEVFYRR